MSEAAADLYVTLRLITPGAKWPRCYYDSSKLCGDPAVDNKPNGVSEVGPTWHIAGFCECPSCPIRCAPTWHIAGFCECPSCPIRCAIRDVMPT